MLEQIEQLRLQLFSSHLLNVVGCKINVASDIRYILRRIGPMQYVAAKQQHITSLQLINLVSDHKIRVTLQKKVHFVPLMRVERPAILPFGHMITDIDTFLL
ncbi:hypothetical protein D1872_267670 [compost metagenome]